MEKVPRKVLFDNWEVLDNMGSLIGASVLNKDNNIWVANPQILALYFMSHFVLFKTINKDARGYTFYLAYRNIQELVKIHFLHTRNYHSKYIVTCARQKCVTLSCTWIVWAYETAFFGKYKDRPWVDVEPQASFMAHHWHYCFWYHGTRWHTHIHRCSKVFSKG